MSLNYEEKQSVVAYRLEKANKTLDDAKKVIELELWEADVKPYWSPQSNL